VPAGAVPKDGPSAASRCSPPLLRSSATGGCAPTSP
jgi:ATP-dependent Lon protease